MKYFVLLAMLAGGGWAVGAELDERCFELRTYTAVPGKLDALHTRFRDHTIKLFAKHGMSNMGYWVPVDNPDQQLVYLLAYPSRQKRDDAWKAFSVDPEWAAAYKESIKQGRLVMKTESVFLKATDYSPKAQATRSEPARLFELRTYITPEDKLDQLHARFRDHTIGLFSKHGMTHYGYWIPTEEKAGAGHTLIYLLAHPDAAARDRAFAGFRADPEWIAAKSASEKQGSLTREVKSILLKPTDYSPSQ